MKHVLLLPVVFVLFVSSLSYSQLTVVSTSPSDGSTNVPLSTTVSVTFSAALDTFSQFDSKAAFISNLDSAITSRWYSPDAKTVNFGVTLQADKNYFFVVYFAPASGGGQLQTPIAVYFTTAGTFSGHTVSGTIHGSSGIDPAYALVALTVGSLGSGDPVFADGGIADNLGNYSIPYVPDGDYYPLSAKDINGDGSIDPSRGDAIAVSDLITVSGADIGGLDMTLVTFPPMGFRDAIHNADSLSQLLLPGDHVLRQIQAYDVDSVGNPGNWEFFYSSASTDTGYRLDVGTFQIRLEIVDSNSFYWLKMMKPLTDLASAADPDSFVVYAERQGGAEFRHMSVPDSLILQTSLTLGDLRYSYFGDMIADTSKLYWGLSYQYGYQVTQNEWHTVVQKRFVGDYSTGSLLVVSGVKEQAGTIPGVFNLRQNYPNPFNPATTIVFDLPVSANVSLRIYDVLGREMATLLNGQRFGAGAQSVHFDASSLPSGMYFYRLQAGNSVSVKKMLLLR